MDGWNGVRDVLALLGWVVLARWQVRRAQRVWRGEPAAWLPLTFRGPEVNRRNHAVFAAQVVLFTGACALLLVGDDTGWTALTAVGALTFVLSLLCLPLLTMITVFNRPQLFIPPRQRHAMGSIAARQARSARRREGLPDTDHEVDLHDVRPLPDDPKPFPPYYVAICAEDGCGWLSDVVDQDTPDAARTVRQMAEQHSSRVVGPTRPVG